MNKYYNIHLHWFVDPSLDLVPFNQNSWLWILQFGGTFSNMHACDHIYVVFKCYNTWTNSQKNVDWQFENPWLMPTCERPEHGHFEMIIFTSQSLSESCAPNNVMLIGKECWYNFKQLMFVTICDMLLWHYTKMCPSSL